VTRGPKAKRTRGRNALSGVDLQPHGLGGGSRTDRSGFDRVLMLRQALRVKEKGMSAAVSPAAETLQR